MLLVPDRCFSTVQMRADLNTPESPFGRLQTDEVWFPVEMIEGRTVRLRREPLVGKGYFEDMHIKSSHHRTLTDRAYL